MKRGIHGEFRTLLRHGGRVDSLRGELSERRTAEAFSLGVEAGNFPSWILSYRQAEKQDEIKGVDAWVQTDIGEIPLQIKSSKRGTKKAKENHPEIPVIVVGINTSIGEIINKVSSAIGPKRREQLRIRHQQGSSS